jgi:hypothetical protein
MLPGVDGSNINGPSCIEISKIVENSLGRYYLYFAHHHGSHIRMAHADELTGPWTIRQGGVLSLSDLTGCYDHIASPDVVIDDRTGEIRMYFHGVDKGSGRQLTFCAQSMDGLNFTASPKPIAQSYLRVVPWRGNWIGMSKGGILYLSVDGRSDFKPLARPALPLHSPDGNAPGDTRHVALHLAGDRLWVAFSRIGDAPEHIRLGYVDLLLPLDRWRLEAHAPLLLPERDWEGATIPVSPGRAGAAVAPEHALRDPYIFRTGKDVWLFYSFAGEQGIALAELPELDRSYRDQPKVAAWPTNDAPGAEDDEVATEMRRLQSPGGLEKKLAELDMAKATKRIFLMGCGRSGTWLLTTLMACFDDTEVVASELPVEAFGTRQTGNSTLVIKRTWDSYARLDAIPESVHILYIMRHPFAVLTSHNPVTQRKYHISMQRWLGEVVALRRLIDSGRKRVVIVTYEELVTAPESTAMKIARSFDLSPLHEPAQAMANAILPPEAIAAMRGLRPPDRDSIGRYRKDPDAIAYLAMAVPILREELDWVAGYFGYDLSL